MIRRCTIEDLDFVDSVLRHDSVYPFISDDHSPPVEEFTSEAMLKNPDVYFLTTNEFTVILAIPILNNVVYDLHINMIKPEGRGKTAKESLKEAIDYMFHDTKCLKLVGFIAVIFGNVINFVCEYAKREGLLKDAYLKDGKLHDVCVVGISKEDWIKGE